jgi:hemolysin D
MKPQQLSAEALQHWFERLTDRLRLGRRLQSFDDEIIPVQVDLVGSGREASPFSGGVDPESALVPSWSFRETVVLRPSRRSSRVVLYTVLGVSGAGLLWLVLAPLDETVAVQGKLEPSSRVKEIQTPVPGVVEAVLVREGQTVKQGTVLLRFDLRDARHQLAAAESVRRQLQDENLTYAAALGDPIAAGRRLNSNQSQRLRDQSQELRNQREAAEQALRASEVRVRGLRLSLATATNIAERYESLVRSGAQSQVQALEARNRAHELATNLAAEERQAAKLRAELSSSRTGPGADLRGRIEENNRQIAELDGRIAVSRQQIRYGELRAPASGAVFNLEARAGTVATAGQPLLSVVPDDALQARVYIPSNAIGFVRPGQRANLSLTTFPAADYGRLPAVVQRVSSDALTSEQQSQFLGEQASGLHYPAVLQLERQTIQAGRRQIPLQPGMALTADIQLRQRRMFNLVTGFFEDKLRSLERLR